MRGKPALSLVFGEMVYIPPAPSSSILCQAYRIAVHGRACKTIVDTAGVSGSGRDVTFDDVMRYWQGKGW